MDQRMKYSYAAVCATGRVRTENQDRIYLNGTICGGGYAQTDGTGRKQGLFAVADGMGGQAQGAQAAQAALEALGQLTGRSLHEDVVSRIFSRFCVGK